MFSRNQFCAHSLRLTIAGLCGKRGCDVFVRLRKVVLVEIPARMAQTVGCAVTRAYAGCGRVARRALQSGVMLGARRVCGMELLRQRTVMQYRCKQRLFDVVRLAGRDGEHVQLHGYLYGHDFRRAFLFMAQRKP